MKRLFFLFMVLFFARTGCYAQDTLVRKDGEELKVRIIEMNSAEIRYKRFDNPDGPLYIIQKDEVRMVKYAGGNREIISSEPDRKQERQDISFASQDLRFIKRGVSWYYKGRKIPFVSISEIIGRSNNDSAARMIEDALATERLSRSLLAAGIVVSGGGLIAALIGSQMARDTYTGNRYTRPSGYYTGIKVEIIGGIAGVFGLAGITASIVLKHASTLEKLEAIRVYNEGIK